MPARIPFVSGEKFGRLTTVREIDVPGESRGRRILCLCDCGSKVVKDYKAMRNGNVRSCGCLRKEVTAAKNTTHGLSDTPEYGHWKGMRQRCTDPNHEKYPSYGGAGVIVCVRWDDFTAFLEDMGPAPSPEYSLDRFPDRHGNYEPGNVRWATASEQARNRDSSISVVYEGKTMLLIELEEIHGFPPGALYGRIRRGWTAEDAVRTPLKLGNNQWTKRKR